MGNGIWHPYGELTATVPLSDSFPEGVRPDVEVRVRMININQGHSQAILRQCRPLQEYSWLIEQVRQFRKATEDLSRAVDAAIEAMPSDYLLKNFLTVNRVEVKTMLLTEYNEAESHELFKEEGRSEERKNTQREKERADAAENRADAAENRADAAENRADAAENRADIAVSRLKEQLIMNDQLIREIARLKAIVSGVN